MCADSELPTANWKRLMPVKGGQQTVNIICPDDKNDSVISAISVWHITTKIAKILFSMQ